MFERWSSRKRRQGRGVGVGWEGCESRVYLSGATFPQQAIVSEAQVMTESPVSTASITSAEQSARQPQALTSFTDFNGHWNVVFFGTLDLEVFGNVNALKLRGTAGVPTLTTPKVKGEVVNGSAVFSVTGKADLPALGGVGKYRYDFVVTLSDPATFRGAYAFYFRNKLSQSIQGADGAKS